jgi:hypothetical protein
MDNSLGKLISIKDLQVGNILQHLLQISHNNRLMLLPWINSTNGHLADIVCTSRNDQWIKKRRELLLLALVLSLSLELLLLSYAEMRFYLPDDMGDMLPEAYRHRDPLVENGHDNGVVSLGGAGKLHHAWRVVDLVDVSINRCG